MKKLIRSEKENDRSTAEESKELHLEILRFDSESPAVYSDERESTRYLADQTARENEEYLEEAFQAERGFYPFFPCDIESGVCRPFCGY